MISVLYLQDLDDLLAFVRPNPSINYDSYSFAIYDDILTRSSNKKDKKNAIFTLGNARSHTPT